MKGHRVDAVCLFTGPLAHVVFAAFETRTKPDIFYYYIDSLDVSPRALGINIPALAPQCEFTFLPLLLWCPPPPTLLSLWVREGLGLARQVCSPQLQSQWKDVPGMVVIKDAFIGTKERWFDTQREVLGDFCPMQSHHFAIIFRYIPQ